MLSKIKAFFMGSSATETPTTQETTPEPITPASTMAETTKETKMASLYERIGGDAAVDAAVDIFYRKVLADDRISEFFDTVDMDAQLQKQKAFLTMAFGGPNSYSGKDMREAHKHMKLTDVHFDAVIENLAATLTELGVPDAEIGEIAGIGMSVKDDVLNR